MFQCGVGFPGFSMGKNRYLQGSHVAAEDVDSLEGLEDEESEPEESEEAEESEGVQDALVEVE